MSGPSDDKSMIHRIAGYARSNKEASVASAASLENLKSISQRRMELSHAIGVKTGDESETSSQHSTSTINTVVELHPAAVTAPDEPCNRRAEDAADVLHASVMGPLPKGWVKHIIGKLQGDAK